MSNCRNKIYNVVNLAVINGKEIHKVTTGRDIYNNAKGLILKSKDGEEKPFIVSE